MKNHHKRITQQLHKMAAIWIAIAMPMLINAQVRIDWQQCYGSLEPDYGFSILPSNSGFTILGQVDWYSSSGMYECNSAFSQYVASWLVGIDDGQSLDWQNCFSDGLYQKLYKAGDDTYYIAGLGLDYYYNYNLRVIQTDELGNILWIKYLGTAHGLDYCENNVFGSSTPDGGIIVATTIDEASGDVSQHFGSYDCWVVKLDFEGNIVWQTTLGTGGNDIVTCLQEAADGGLLLWIDSDQIGNGNIGCGQPENKGVLVKIDALGQIQWDHCFERTSVVSIVEMEDGYLLAGSQRYTVEPNGNCGNGIYTYDCYLLRCDLEGNVIWDKEFGGSCNDKMVKVLHNSIDNGFTAFTNSKSMDGDVESFANLGVIGNDEGNIWMFHVDAEGHLLWEYCIGSQLGLWEEIQDVVAVGDGEYAIVGINTWFNGVSSGLVNCSNNLLLPNSGSNIWALHVTDIYDYDGYEMECAEWYYEILNDDSSITYQHLECVGDTLFDREGKRPKIIIRSNTQYDKDLITETTREYIYEENGKVYWWNKDLEEFTVLYDFAAEEGDEWEIKVGTESITVHVDAVDVFEYDGESFKQLHISDVGNVFNGDIVVNFGHLTSFFPEKLMNRNGDFTVDGLRCYWVEDVLVYHNGDEDCDAIYDGLHGLEENGPSTGPGAFMVYPNPANGVLFVETHGRASLPVETEYRITNLMGQTVLSGLINAEKQQIDISRLPAGMYFINVGDGTRKFVAK